ncbi:MAG: prephenate dehydratase [Acidobacteriaceae bacterium]
MQVAIQGELGSFSHEAAMSLLPESYIVACANAADVLRKLSSGGCAAAVVPVENSLVGSVVDFYDLFFEHSFVVERELLMRIRHNLIAGHGATERTVRKVFSHPVALGQCKRFFAANPHLQPTAFYDTAGSVRYVMEANDPELAAIASKQAAAQYGATVLREGIEDREESYTRFWLIRRKGSATREPMPTKLSVVFLLENRPGALLQALSAFAARSLNLTKIESRPMPGRPWEYMFYADVTVPGHAEADAALHDLAKICTVVKELGRYRADEPHPMR